MIIGKVNLDTGKKYTFLLDNYKEYLQDYYYERTHKILVCCKCGQMLAPTIQLYGPNGCGWRKDRNGKWLCHQCYFGWNGFDDPNEEVIRRNHEIQRKLMEFNLNHPWIKFKKI